MYENIYYSPEAFGLKIVASIDYSDGNYQFDTRVVWENKDGKRYTARDSGCSCPTPFEDYHSVNDLQEFDFEQLRREVNAELDKEWRNITPEEGQNFLDSLRR